ncbi:MAG: hypothetical protein ACREX3_00120 [Gammaproteobacteria bacterium]
MTDTPCGEPVRVTGEKRLHPALRKLGRACIALARWQREQQQTLNKSDPAKETSAAEQDNQPTSETETLKVPDQEHLT